MKHYEFTVILMGSRDLTDDLCDALYAAGCDDSSPGSSCGITRIDFDRESDSLEEAIRSTGCEIARVEIDAEAPFLGSAP